MREAIELYYIGSWRVPEALCQFEMQFKKKFKKSAVTLLILMNGSIQVTWKAEEISLLFDNLSSFIADKWLNRSQNVPVLKN